MKKLSHIIIMLGIVLFNFAFAQDVILSLNGQNLEYTSTEDIAGWQFSHDGCASSSGGGDSANAGFSVSCSGNTCLAFSFTGAVVSAGSGVLVELAPGECTEESLSGFVFSYGYSALWLIPGIWAGYIFMWLVLGPSIRKNSKINNWITPTDFISANLKENEN